MKKQIKKISENKYQIITPQEPIIEEVSIGDIKNELERLETEKIDITIFVQRSKLPKERWQQMRKIHRALKRQIAL